MHDIPPHRSLKVGPLTAGLVCVCVFACLCVCGGGARGPGTRQEAPAPAAPKPAAAAPKPVSDEELSPTERAKRLAGYKVARRRVCV
jgi:hypothetical protein